MAEATTQAMDVDAGANGAASGAPGAPTSTPPAPMSLSATGEGNGVSTAAAPMAPTAPSAPTSGAPVAHGLQAPGAAGAALGAPTAPQPPAPPIPPQQVTLPQSLGAVRDSCFVCVLLRTSAWYAPETDKKNALSRSLADSYYLLHAMLRRSRRQPRTKEGSARSRKPWEASCRRQEGLPFLCNSSKSAWPTRSSLGPCRPSSSRPGKCRGRCRDR